MADQRSNESSQGQHFYQGRKGNPKLSAKDWRLISNLVLDVAGERKRTIVLRKDTDGSLVEENTQKRIMPRYLDNAE